VGQSQSAAGARALRASRARRAGPPQRAGAVRARPARRGRPRVSRAGALRHAQRVAVVVRLQHVPAARRLGPGELRPRLPGAARAGDAGRSQDSRDQERHVHRAELRPQDDPHRRHALRRRTEEGDLHDAQLSAPRPGRVADALLGESGRERRRGPVLRPLRHRQDDALGRSRARPDRRRRARLVRSGRVQFRGRLLRQGHPAVARRRA